MLGKLNERLENRIKEKDTFQQFLDSPKNHIIAKLLKSPKYRIIIQLMVRITHHNAEIDISQLILTKSLNGFLNQYTDALGKSVVNMIRDCLEDFYQECDKQLHPKPYAQVPARQQTVATPSFPRAEPLPTLSELKLAATVNDKLQLLNDSGWLLGHSLITNKNWNALNEYILILATLPKDIVERQQFHCQNASGKTFINLLTTPAVKPQVIFNLLNNFAIEDKDIIKIARISCLKEDVKFHIGQLEMDDKSKLLQWEICVKPDTSLGKFFRTPRTTSGIIKSYVDTGYEPNIVKNIQFIIGALKSKIEVTLAIEKAHLEHRESFTLDTTPTSSSPRISQPSFFRSETKSEPTQTVVPPTPVDTTGSFQSVYVIFALMGLSALLLRLHYASSFADFCQDTMDENNAPFSPSLK